MPILDLTGTRFGRLVAQWPVGQKKNKSVVWLCLCDCGNLTYQYPSVLRDGNTRSCGCLNNECRAARVRTHGKTDTTECEMWYRVKRRAKEQGLEFNLEISDITIPEICPLLGIPLVAHNSGQPDSPSLDRINSLLGYVKGNVWVVSMKANAAKNNLTLEEMQLLVRNWEQEEKKQWLVRL